MNGCSKTLRITGGMVLAALLGCGSSEGPAPAPDAALGRGGGQATGGPTGRGGGGGTAGATGKGGTTWDAGFPDAKLDGPSEATGDGSQRDAENRADAGNVDGEADGMLSDSAYDGAAAPPLGMYVGCADSTGSIMYFELNRTSGIATPIGTYTTGVSNSWITLNAAQNRMYICSRTEGRITSLARDTTSGALTVLGTVPVPYTPPPFGDAGRTDAEAGGDAETSGADAGASSDAALANPSSQTVTLDATERYLLVANYSANYVYVYAVNADGTVGPLVAAHSAGISAHETVFPPGSNNDFVLVPYRGSGMIALYGFDETSGALSLLRTTATYNDAGPNPGPRHLAFHPAHNTWMYAINEIAGTVSYYNFNNSTGDLSFQNQLSSVPADYTGTDKLASELKVAPSGNYLYVSNRYSTAATFTQEGSLGVFAINSTTGQLTAVGFESSRGAVPRHFALSKDGSALVVGNQNSNNIAVFGVNAATGALSFKATRDVCATPFFIQLTGD